MSRVKSDLSTLEVLFVDDEEQTLKYLSRAFSSLCQVRLAANVAEALVILKSSKNVAVVVTDQIMPGGTGTELLSWISEHRPHIVRILTTAYADLSSAIESINRGEVFRFVEKPWTLTDLEVLLDEAIVRFRENLSIGDYASVSDEIILHKLISQVANDCEGWKSYAMHSLDRVEDYEAGIEAIANKHAFSLTEHLNSDRTTILIEELDNFIDETFLSNTALAQVQVAVNKAFNTDIKH